MDVDVTVTVETELNDYTRVKQMSLDKGPLMWWNHHVQEFPHLFHMTRCVFHFCVSGEALHYSVGLVKSDLWGNLLDTTLIDVMWSEQAP